MVSETLAKVRTEQGCHGHLGGAFGDCEEAKKAGARMGGKNDAERKDPGVRVPNRKFSHFYCSALSPPPLFNSDFSGGHLSRLKSPPPC